LKLALETSALIAIFLQEPEADTLSARLENAEEILMCTASILEAQMVLSRRYPDGGATAIDKFLRDYDVTVIAFSLRELAIAREAFLAFGKGRHPAKLNFGDCMSYALAKSQGVPLLFKGEDFALTDIKRAL
jgi:ribonuclease VapC